MIWLIFARSSHERRSWAGHIALTGRAEFSRSRNPRLRKRMRLTISRQGLARRSGLAGPKRPKKALDAEVDRDPVGFVAGIDAVATQKCVERAALSVDRRRVPGGPSRRR